MGNVWENSIVKKEDVEKNIENINYLTKKGAIMEFTGLYLDFSMDKDLFSHKKIIKVIIKKYDQEKGIDSKKRSVRLTIEQFYSFYNALMNSVDYFYNQKLIKRIKTLGSKSFDNYGSDESSLCPICDENKVEVSLPCSHFFCEKCIKSWVIKSETCPLCRFKLKFKKDNENDVGAGIVGSQRWDIINNDEEFKNQIKEDNKDLLLKLTKDLFYKK